MPMIDLTLTAGALEPETRAKLVNDLTAALLRGEGAPDNEATELVLAAEGSPNTPENAARVWVQIYELADGFWGGAGQIFRMKDIAALAKAGEAVPA
jgi:phenylpyruvate tautomerase PptA (4-oxalocrotonate tautomerase family)